MGSFDEQSDGAGPRSVGASGVVVLSESPLVADGLVGLLPRQWRDRVSVVTDARALESRLDGHASTAIIDTDATDAADAIVLSRERAAAVIALVGSDRYRLAPEVLDQADAIVDLYEAEPLTLRVAIAAGHLGMRLVPRSDPRTKPPVRDLGDTTLSEPARRVLSLLAAGMRDAEIARQLNLSESSVRKLVQRTVRAVGARTRCQAIAIVARSGTLEPSGTLRPSSQLEPVAPA
jgi:DNA-binding NarL/FixJ family response regulator